MKPSLSVILPLITTSLPLLSSNLRYQSLCCLHLDVQYSPELHSQTPAPLPSCSTHTFPISENVNATFAVTQKNLKFSLTLFSSHSTSQPPAEAIISASNTCIMESLLTLSGSFPGARAIIIPYHGTATAFSVAASSTPTCIHTVT